MSSCLSPPLTPAGCDLRDFQYLPLDVERLRDSELATLESPEACWAAVLLWCASWHQVPAASLPNDERILANYAGYFHRGKVDPAWESIRAGAMRNWVLCSDDRYYHPVVAEKANVAWESKWLQAHKSELARIKKHNQRHPDKQVHYPTLEEFLSSRTSPDCPRDNPLVSLGQSDSVPEKMDPIETKGILNRNNKYDALTSLISLGVERRVAEDWLALRKSKRAAVTSTAIEAINDEARKANVTLQRALIIACQHGWAGFKAEWVQSQALNSAIKSDLMPWFMTASGIEEKGKELGIELGKDEQPPAYRQRICRLAGVTEDEWRKAHVDFNKHYNPLYPVANLELLKPRVDRTGKPPLREALKA